MTKNFKELLIHVEAFAFDVDGVFSSSITFIQPDGQLFRTANIKDGYSIQLLRKKGYPVAIITGGNYEGVRKRFENLGVTDIYLAADNKQEALQDFVKKHQLDISKIMYMGDDIPDIPPMKIVGIPVCPADAAEDVKMASRYISDKKGGEGCVRDVVEQVLRAREDWLNENDHIW